MSNFPTNPTKANQKPENLKELDHAIRHSTLAHHKRLRMRNDLQTLAKWLDMPMDQISTVPEPLNRLLQNLKHEKTHEVSPKRKSNVISSLRMALEHTGVCQKLDKSYAKLSPWRNLYEKSLSETKLSTIRPFIIFCALEEIAPEDVTYQTFKEWWLWKRQNTITLTTNPKASIKRAVRAWNQLATTTESSGIGLIQGKRKKLAASSIDNLLPASFLIDLANFKHLGGTKATSSTEASNRYKAAFQRVSNRPLSETKVEHCISSLKLAAKTAIETGLKHPDEIRTISDVLNVEIASITVEQAENRNGPSEYLLSIAKDLKCAAKRWLTLNEEQELQWKELITGISNYLAEEIGHHRNLMTKNNRKKLLEILEPNALEKLICFPWKTLEKNETYRQKTGIATYGMALDICSSVAVAILFTLPVRRGNLCRLEWQKNISVNVDDDTGFLNIPGSEVKNKRPLTALLPSNLCKLLKIYQKHYWPLLMDEDTCCQYLFPTRNGNHRAATALGNTISQRVAEATDIKINVHLFRHIVATLAIQEASKSGEISHARSLVEGLLGATPGSNVSQRYAELTTTIASEWFYRNVTTKFFE
ncbi:site-specific integrase [Thalassospira sp. MCCC 1A02491]|uniref:site-specific integrase n=1 Tax=Thalassospira sp. MCCC 1A02491 TaxID=1769751 RepID=UPI00083972F9|nr:site-specific integrase [Thalassospira sp. MCCC 1A02491]